MEHLLCDKKCRPVDDLEDVNQLVHHLQRRSIESQDELVPDARVPLHLLLRYPLSKRGRPRSSYWERSLPELGRVVRRVPLPFLVLVAVFWFCGTPLAVPTLSKEWLTVAKTAAIDRCSCLSHERSRRSLRRRALPVPLSPPCPATSNDGVPRGFGLVVVVVQTRCNRLYVCPYRCTHASKFWGSCPCEHDSRPCVQVPIKTYPINFGAGTRRARAQSLPAQTEHSNSPMMLATFSARHTMDAVCSMRHSTYGMLKDTARSASALTWT